MVLLSSIGFQKTFKMILQFPALIMAPVFSYWTFGDPTFCHKRNYEGRLKASFRFTWGNCFITAMGNLGLFLVHLSSRHLVQDFTFNLQYHIVSCTCLVLSWITLILLHNLQKWQKCCCAFCQLDQVYQKSALDPDNPDELIDLSHDKENMQVMRTLFGRMNSIVNGSIFE